ncbi:hypothetical protein [Roseateles sp.]|uniref:hypothetical protein n=1 Tax=Roseateles sp. TaxID=1971397 RepID=UPI003D0CE01F
MTELDLTEFNTSFSFQRRPVSLPGDLRPAWRIGLIAILLSQCCRQQRSSLTRLHVLSWAVRSKANHDDLLSLVNHALPPDALIVRFDPAVNRAIDLAIGEKLINRVDGSRIELSKAGREFSKEIFADAQLYVAEKALAASLKQKVSESVVDEIFGKRK